MPQPPLSTETARRKVLIVDDKQETRDVVAIRIGEDPRYIVCKAANHAEAMAVVDETPDLFAVFIDQQFGNDDRGGLAILKAILDKRPLLPAILYTAAPVEDIRREAFDSGALWYLPKVKVSGAEDLQNILEVASKLVDVMPVDTDPRFLKRLLDAAPIQIMVRDRAGRVYWQNKAKEDQYGPIVPGETYCWHRYEGRRNEPDDKCPCAERDCPCERIYASAVHREFEGPITAIYRYAGGASRPDGTKHSPGWLYLAASGIGSVDGEPAYVVETASDVTVQIYVLHLISNLAQDQTVSEHGVLKLVTDRLVEQVGFSRARAWEFDPVTERLTCRAIAGHNDTSFLGEAVQLPAADLEQLRKGELLTIPRDRLVEIVPHEIIVRLDPAEMCLWAPFRVSGELAGLLVIDKKGQKSERISELDKYWMSFLGQHISAVVERIRTTDELRERHANAEWLEKLDRDISGIDNFPEVLHIVINRLQEKLGADLTQFHRLSPDWKTIFLAVDNGKHALDCPMRGGYSSEIGVNGTACKDDMAIFLDSTEGNMAFLEYRNRLAASWSKACSACELYPVSMACLPIHAGSQVVGSLCLAYAQPHSFSPSDQDLLKRVCDSISIALKATQRLSVAEPGTMEARRVQGVQIIARGLTHALRNIAQVISNFAGGIEVDAGNPEKVVQYSAEVNKQVANMTSLFDALARHAAIPAEGPDAAIHQMIRDLVTLQRRRYYDYGIVLKSQLAPECEDARKNQDKFLVVLLTLLENAFAATLLKSGAREILIETHLTADRSNVVVAVRDTGVGMSTEKAARIFEWPPVELSNAPSVHGVGLPIARSLIQSMRGDIRIESKEGVGTVATVELPIKETIYE